MRRKGKEGREEEKKKNKKEAAEEQKKIAGTVVGQRARETVRETIHKKQQQHAVTRKPLFLTLWLLTRTLIITFLYTAPLKT